jgi:hypothetical protein
MLATYKGWVWDGFRVSMNQKLAKVYLGASIYPSERVNGKGE